MTAPAPSALATETLAQQNVGTYRLSQHGGHGCCQDRDAFGATARAQGRGGALSLVGFGTYAPGVPTLPAVAVTLSCRSWRCPCCATRLRARSRARAFMGASGERVVMMLLTIDPSDPRFLDTRNRAGKVRPRSTVLLNDPRAADIEDSTRYVAWAWNRLRTYMTREYGAVPYFRGLELHKSGRAHLHVLMRVRDAVEFMRLSSYVLTSRVTVRAGFGPIGDVVLARSGGDVARYVTKASGGQLVRQTVQRGQRVGMAAAAYVSKLPDALPRYTRRSAWSLDRGKAPWAPGWVKPTPVAGFTWRVAKCSAETARAALAVSGDFHVVDPGSLRISTAATAVGGTW